MKRALFLVALAAAFISPSVKAQTSAHDAKLTATLAASCTTATPCYTSMYRVQVASKTSACPTTLTSYTQIASSLPGTTVTSTGTTTVYDDQDSALLSNTSYCYVATDSYVSGGGESAMGPSTLVTFPGPPNQPTGLTATVVR